MGLTGSGLLDLICELRRAGVIERSGRFAKEHPTFGHRLSVDERGVRRLLITDQAVDLRGAESLADAAPTSLYLTQHDVRELQKAKGAIRAATEILMEHLGLQPGDLQRMILTGSFGSQLNVEAVVGLGMIPPVALDRVEPSANGAGFGAALLLDDAEFARGERIAAAAEQVDLDLDRQLYRPLHRVDGPAGRATDVSETQASLPAPTWLGSLAVVLAAACWGTSGIFVKFVADRCTRRLGPGPGLLARPHDLYGAADRHRPAATGLAARPAPRPALAGRHGRQPGHLSRLLEPGA